MEPDDKARKQSSGMRRGVNEAKHAVYHDAKCGDRLTLRGALIFVLVRADIMSPVFPQVSVSRRWNSV